jgi:ribonuclease T2
MGLNLNNEDSQDAYLPLVSSGGGSATPKSSNTRALLIVAVAAILVATTYVLNPMHCPDHKTAPAADFELYIMSMSYQPEFCHKHEDFPGCRKPENFWKSHLTIHGMWPEFKDGTWPQFCTTEELDNATIAPLLPLMEHLWPNVKALQPTAQHFFDFWKHEWSKHGTCSGLTQLQYFDAALHHFVDTPSIIADNYGGTINKADLLQAYKSNTTDDGDDDVGDVILACQAKHWLSEVRICIGVTPNGAPTHRVPCPASVVSDKSCVGDEIRIAAFVPI